MEESQSEIVSLYGSRSKKRCMEYALVLLAVGIRCEVLPRDGKFALMVDARDADGALEQLRLYLHEHRAWPPRFDPRFGAHDGLVCACLYGVTILLFDILQRNQAFSLDWWGAGLSHAGLIREGEWWRAVTALALHADTLHLAGNLVFGLVFGFFAGDLLGWGLAWSGMLLAGALGNVINAFVQAPGHTSIGASTAVFATLGILAAYTWKRRRTRINRWVPLGGGVALLAFLGMGGERTDIFAHFAGFGSGCLFGLVFGVLETRSLLAAWHKHTLGLAAFLFFALAWTLALLARG
ncbi:MAG: rhomboid family intramembrane serine protease [Alphaproteobacteria bacterium]|nr:rhomboid family intramembrane serine protease [Alphaproteobacteria bacterium]